MSLTKKRVHLYEVKDGITYDEDVDVYTSTDSVLFEDGESLQDKLDNGVLSVDILGDLEDLGTEDKSSMVASLNEINEIVQSNGDILSGGGEESGYAFAFGREELDGSWGSVSTLPYSFYYGGAVVYNGEIHIIGGSGNTTKYYKYNGNTWESIGTLPCYFSQGSVVVLNGEIHIMGSNESINRTSHYKYNGSIWESVSTLPYNFYNGCVAVLNNQIHIMGSSNSSTYYKCHYKYNNSSWSSVSTLPYYFYNGSAVVLDNQIHIMGSSNSNYRQLHYKYNGSSWSSATGLPYPFYDGSAVVLNDEIHIFGSVNSSSYYKYHYKWDGTSWTSVSTLPYNFYRGSALLHKGQVHILGGSGGDTSHYKLNSGTLLSGYVKSNTQIYQPNGHAYSNNLATLDNNMFEVTQDGLVEMILED